VESFVLLTLIGILPLFIREIDKGKTPIRGKSTKLSTLIDKGKTPRKRESTKLSTLIDNAKTPIRSEGKIQNSSPR
jgi:hypothetical protein